MCELTLREAKLKIFRVIIRARSKHAGVHRATFDIVADNSGSAFHQGLIKTQEALGEISTISITTRRIRH